MGSVTNESHYFIVAYWKTNLVAQSGPGNRVNLLTGFNKYDL